MTYKQISMLVYLAALFTPIFIGPVVFGFFGLFLGWMGIMVLDPFIALPWIANLMYFGNLIFNNPYLKVKIGISFFTIVLSLFAIGIHEVPENEGGTNSDVVVGIGFLLWISSFVILLIGQLKIKKGAAFK